jgi:parvulin-like peptidyl-prolyl isomerase
MSALRATPLWLPLLVLAACADLTAPTTEREVAGQQPAAAVNKAEPAQRAPANRPAPPPRAPAGDTEKVSASHILIAYQGSARSRATRSKDEARKLADQLARQAKGGADFAKLAVQHSDDPSAKQRGGDLGSFERRRMVKPFADAAFSLKPGEVSGVVETPFGFHIIKRTK